MSQGANRVIVVRVRGLPRDHSAATILEAAIDCPTENYKATILPSCDRLNESVALVNFKQKLPPSLASLESDRSKPWQISIDDEDLSFDENFLGFTQLYPTNEPIQADIVAICGIDGHAYGSWQGRGSLRRMWLRHFLCKDLPSCRTMIYGYKAKLSSKDSATIEDYAKDFLEALRRVRQNVPINRPIIFIAHSFGGLIIARAMVKLKQALVTKEVTLASIYHSICGVLFFAVPFRGIDVEDMSRIMDAQSHPRASLLKHFSVGSGDLKRQLTEFIDVLYGLKVVSFFETEQSRRLIRNESGEWQRFGEYFTTLEADSAVLNLPEEMETRIALHSDHSGIVKFDDKYDAGYEYAIRFLQSFLENNRGMLQKQKLLDGPDTGRQLYMSQGSSMNHTSSPQASTSMLRTDGTAHIWQFATSNQASTDFAHVRNNHRSSVQPLRTQSRSKDDNDCLAKLAAADPRLEKKRIQTTKGGLLKGSYSWVTGNEQYKKWQSSPDDGLLWIRGDPGKGKTMLLCGIIDEFDNPQSISYFFCQATDSRLNKATSVLRGLIYMLADQNPSTISHLRRRFERGSISENADAWWVLCDMLEDIFRELKNIYLLVDALDECGTGRDELIQFAFHTSSSTEYQAKWIVSSRNWPDIRNSLYGASSLSLELNAESVSSAVIHYIQYKVSNLAAKKSYDGVTRDYILKYLLANAKGTFLWVALVCTNLEKAKSWNARRTVLMFPPDLEQVYEHMIQLVHQSDDSEHYQKVLATAATVHRPVSLAELQTLVDLPKEITDTTATFRDFIDDCGSFLTVQDDRIEFVHQSAKDFVDKILEKQGLPRLRDLHLIILERSVRAMSHILKKDNYGLKDPSLDVSCIELPKVETLQGIYYACLYWFQHLKDVKLKPTESYLIDMLYAFLRDKVLYWLEAVSLFHSVWYAISLLHELQLHLEPHSQFDGLRDLAHDSYRFAQYFREGIVHNPLQIYVSGMLFTPKQSAYKKQLIREAPSWLQLQLYEDESWPSIITAISNSNETGYLVSAVYSCDSKRIVTRAAHSDGLQVWDTVSGAQIRHLASRSQDQPEASSGNSVSSSELTEDIVDNDTSKLHSAPAEHEQTSESSQTMSRNRCYKTLNPNLDPAFAPGNDKVYYISRQGCLMSWDIQTGEELGLLDLDFSKFYHAISTDGRHVAYIADSHVNLYRIDSQTRLSLPHESDSFEILAFSSNGTGLCASSSAGDITVWDTRSETVIGSVDSGLEYIDTLALANNLKFLSATSEVEGLLAVAAIESGSIIWQLNWSGEVAFSFDSLRLACGRGYFLRIYNVSDGSFVTELTPHVIAIAFSPDCRQLAHGTFRGFKLLDLTTFDRNCQIAPGTRIGETCFNHKSSRIVVQREDNYELWDLKSKTLIWKQIGYFIPGGSGDWIIARTPDTWRPTVWHLGENSVEMTGTAPDFRYPIDSIFLAPDNTRALVRTLEPYLFIWDLETGAFRSLHVGILSRCSGNIYWDTATQRVSFAMQHDTALVVDTSSGNILLRAPVVLDPVQQEYEIYLSSSGRVFACLDSSSTVAVWDVDSGKQVSEHETSLNRDRHLNICLSKDDQYLAIGKEFSIDIFDITTNSWLQSVHINRVFQITSFFRSADSMTIFTTHGCVLVKKDKIALGTDDRLFTKRDWLYRENRKLIWLPSRSTGQIKFHGGGFYIVETEGGFAVFRTRFDSTGLNEV